MGVGLLGLCKIVGGCEKYCAKYFITMTHMGISLLVTFRIISVLLEKRLILSFSFPVTSLRNSQNSINDIKGYNGPYNRNAGGSTSYGFPF